MKHIDDKFFSEFSKFGQFDILADNFRNISILISYVIVIGLITAVINYDCVPI